MPERPVRLPRRCWLVALDGAKALLLRNVGSERAPKLVLVRAMEKHAPPTREIGTDRPGRVHQSLGQSRSAVESRDLHLVSKQSFVDEVAASLTMAARENDIPAIVLAAPPKLLHHLREGLPSSIQAMIVSEFRKDLTNLPIPDIESHFSA